MYACIGLTAKPEWYWGQSDLCQISFGTIYRHHDALVMCLNGIGLARLVLRALCRECLADVQCLKQISQFCFVVTGVYILLQIIVTKSFICQGDLQHHSSCIFCYIVAKQRQFVRHIKQM